MRDDEIYRLLTRADDASERLALVRPVWANAGGSKAFVGKVYNAGSMPTSVPAVFMVRPCAVSFTEAEGAVSTVTPDVTKSVAVLVYGPNVPAVGDDLVCVAVGSRWVARKGSGGSVPPLTGEIRGCTCATPPAVLTMTSSRGGCSDGLLNSCTIAYQTVPASLAALRLGNAVNKAYLSTELFTDTQTGDQFYYFMGCFASIFRISRVFPTSVFGSPFLDSVIYYWSVGLPGNTCNSTFYGTPFLLSNGQIYFGGDPSCLVTIAGP